MYIPLPCLSLFHVRPSSMSVPLPCQSISDMPLPAMSMPMHAGQLIPEARPACCHRLNCLLCTYALQHECKVAWKNNYFIWPLSPGLVLYLGTVHTEDQVSRGIHDLRILASRRIQSASRFSHGNLYMGGYQDQRDDLRILTSRRIRSAARLSHGILCMGTRTRGMT